MPECCVVRLRVEDDAALSFGASEYVPMVPEPLPEYVGPYEVTPGQSAQTLATAGKAMTANLTVGAIPSNYGLITWDGATITVS